MYCFYDNFGSYFKLFWNRLIYELLKQADFFNAGFQQDDDSAVLRVALCQLFRPVHPSILYRSVLTGMQI